MVTGKYQKQTVWITFYKHIHDFNECYVFSGNLKKMLKKISESQNEDEQNKNSEALQELVTYVQFANDEMDWLILNTIFY